MNIQVHGSYPVSPSETSTGRALTPYYLARALDAEGPCGGSVACDILIAVDDPMLIRGYDARRRYLWLTSPESDFSAAREACLRDRRLSVVAACPMTADRCRRAGVTAKEVIPVGVRDDFADAPHDAALRHAAYVCMTANDKDVQRSLAAATMAAARVPALVVTLISAVSHEQMPARLGKQGILVHLPMGATSGLVVKEALVAGRAIVSNTSGVLDGLTPGAGHGVSVKSATDEIVRLADHEAAFLESCARSRRYARYLQVRWSEVAERWRAIF